MSLGIGWCVPELFVFITLSGNIRLVKTSELTDSRYGSKRPEDRRFPTTNGEPGA